jgi:5'-nucleotidase
MRHRRAPAVVLLLPLLFLLSACVNTLLAPSSPSKRSLHILLTNDDGVEAPGIAALREALVAEGHRVVVVAPSTNQSGTSASLTTRGVLVVRQLEPNVYAVDGTPADCVLVGTRKLIADPIDLVVSGINMGQNVGRRTMASGTVGATIAAATVLLPAVAFSQAVDAIDYRKTPRFFPGAAAFAASFVTALAEHDGNVVPPGILLNVNMPARYAREAHGVRLTRQGHSVLYELRYVEQSSGRYQVRFVPSYIEETIPGADTTALMEGYISVTPLEGSWNADEDTWKEFRSLTGRLEVPGAAASP